MPMKRALAAPVARIALRYGVGLVVGMEAGRIMAGDPDIVILAAACVAAGIEAAYVLARKKGWAT